MKTIYKYPITFTDDSAVEILMPAGSEILCLQTQVDMPCMWAMVETRNPQVSRYFRVFGTGHPLPPMIARSRYIGTFQIDKGLLVFHVFEVGGP